MLKPLVANLGMNETVGTRFVISVCVNVAARFPTMHILGRLQEQ